MRKFIDSVMPYFGGRALTEKKMVMQPMTGITITVEGTDEEEIRMRFSKAMASMVDMWTKQPEQLIQRLK